MNVCQLEITKAAINHGRISIRPCGEQFFPEDVFGQSSADRGIGKPISLIINGIETTIKTDIPTEQNGRPRWFFRNRSWVKPFIRQHQLEIGDKISIIRLSQRKFKLEPLNGTLTFIDLFAGIGGMRIGFEDAGAKCVFSSEWDKFAQQTYEANFHEKPYGDITKIKSSDIPDHDILIGGFPCQPFSISGVSKKNALGRPHGFDDPAQGTLFFEIKRILKDKRPRAFLLENVKNLKSHDKGQTYRIIKESLEKDLGYTVFDKVINADKYVPQNRERIFIVGFREFMPFDFPETMIQKKPVFKSILEPRVPSNYTLTDHLWNYLQKYAEKHKRKGNGFGFGLTDLNGRSRTMSARYYKDGSEILIPQKNGKNPRRLTPRECANLMGFTQFRENFKIPVSDTQAYKQFGNSVVVPAVYDIARKMINTLEGNI